MQKYLAPCRSVFHPAEMIKGERQQSLGEVAAGGVPAMYMALIFATQFFKWSKRWRGAVSRL